MASVARATTYDSANSMREDLSNLIYDISPTTTPFMSNIGKDTADNTYFEWQTDSLAAAVSTNAVIEGADAGNADFVPDLRITRRSRTKSCRFPALPRPWTWRACAR